MAVPITTDWFSVCQGVLHMQLWVTVTSDSFFVLDVQKITRHPENQSAVTGTAIAITVQATGDDLQFLWQKGGRDIDKNDNTGTFAFSM